MSDPSTTQPPEPAESPSPQASSELSILPAPIFFTELIEVPEKLEAEELDALVELEIEQTSPFPIEQLVWGWILVQNRSKAIAFATTLEKARTAGVSSFDSPQLPILSTYAACDYTPSGAANILFYGPKNEAIAIVYDDDGSPSEIQAFALEEGADEAEYSDMARGLLAEAGRKSFRHFYLGDPVRTDDSGLQWPIFDRATPAESTDPVHTAELDSSAAWYADLRDRDFKAERQKQLQQSGRLWKALTVMAIIVIVMLCLEAVQWSVRGFLDFQNVTIAQQTPLQERLEQQNSFLVKLLDIEQSQMRPFAVLAILNENRPARIHFLRAEAIDSNEYQIQAQGTAVTEVNNYVASYQGNPAFSSIQHEITSSRSGRVIFELTVKVGQLPAAKALSPAPPTPVDEEASES